MTLLVFEDDIFSRNLKYLRKKKQLSQKKLAQRSGINLFWLRGIERGRFRAEISASDYWKLCEALDVKPEFFRNEYLP
jgi:transcriptional regulator with XRE-family HTH domain